MSGQGLGLRQPLFSALEAELPDCIDFFEVAPEKLAQSRWTMAATL